MTNDTLFNIVSAEARTPDNHILLSDVMLPMALLQEGKVNGARWYYKGAKMTLLWPLWSKAFKDAVWVVVRRDEEKLRASLNVMLLPVL